MDDQQKLSLSDVEWHIMNALWKLGEPTLGQVVEAVSEFRMDQARGVLLPGSAWKQKARWRTTPAKGPAATVPPSPRRQPSARKPNPSCTGCLTAT